MAWRSQLFQNDEPLALNKTLSLKSIEVDTAGKTRAVEANLMVPGFFIVLAQLCYVLTQGVQYRQRYP